jgi:hypothetical protein
MIFFLFTVELEVGKIDLIMNHMYEVVTDVVFLVLALGYLMMEPQLL